MTNKAGTIEDIRGKIQELESERDQLQVQIESLYKTLWLFEEKPLPSDSHSMSAYAESIITGMQVILHSEGPLHRSQIYQKLRLRGLEVGGSNPQNTIGAYLSRSPLFKNVGRGEWALVEDSVP